MGRDRTSRGPCPPLPGAAAPGDEEGKYPDAEAETQGRCEDQELFGCVGQGLGGRGREPSPPPRPVESLQASRTPPLDSYVLGSSTVLPKCRCADSTLVASGLGTVVWAHPAGAGGRLRVPQPGPLVNWPVQLGLAASVNAPPSRMPSKQHSLAAFCPGP